MKQGELRQEEGMRMEGWGCRRRREDEDEMGSMRISAEGGWDMDRFSSYKKIYKDYNRTVL